MARKPTLALTGALLVTAFAGLSPAAHAAYAPKFSAELSPATPATAAAISTTITQAPMETANRTVVVQFPVGFSANLDARPGICADLAQGCPPDSKIGAARATASVVLVPVNLTGEVFYGGATAKGIRLLVVLRGAPDGDRRIEGFVSFRPDGGFNVTFDGLPDTLTTSFTLALEGDAKALSVTPSTCGRFVFKAAFTSQRGEQATAEAPVTVAGCRPTPLEIVNLDLSRRGTVGFNLTTKANGTIRVSRGPRTVSTKPFTGRRGTNAVRTLRKGRTLAKGLYAVRVQGTTPEGETITSTRRIRIR